MRINADHLGETGETVNPCMQVQRAPSLPLIQLSSEGRGHDLTSAPLMACEVSLKFSVHRYMLMQRDRGLMAADREKVRSSGAGVSEVW